MRKSLYSLVLPAALFLAGYAPGVVAAQPANGDPTLMYKEAGANADQLDKIRALGKSFEESGMHKSQEAQALLRTLRELSLKPTPDEKAVISTQESLDKLHDDMSMARIKLMLAIRHVLTPEQRVHLIKSLQEHPPINPGR